MDLKMKEQIMIEYIANGLPTWTYVLISIVTAIIAKKIIG